MLEKIIYDYNWIIEVFNDQQVTVAVPDIYHFLLQSVHNLIEKDKNLHFFKFIEYYSIKENPKEAGFIRKENIKKINKNDLTFLYKFQQI